jgi:hypothetical protein
VVGKRNYAYARVRNRGTNPATGLVVRGYHCRPAAGLVWPDDWKPMHTASIAVGGSIATGGETVVGPFEWTPTHRGHEGMLMSVSAIGDSANTDPLTFLPCAAGPTPLWRLVPNDNNLGLRALVPVPGGGGKKALVKAFVGRRFWAQNPFPHPDKVEVRVTLPPFLASRGWSVALRNAGGGSFSLGPRASRVIRPRLIPGSSFTAAQVLAAGDVTIVAEVLVDGLVVGGITYVLDAQLKHPAVEALEPKPKHDHDHDHDHHHHEPPKIEVERRGRRVKVEIDID